MPDTQEFRDEYARLSELTERGLAEVFPTTEGDPAARVIEAARYSLLAGGKRIRPVLALSVAQMLGCPLGEALPYACAVEMIHTYSLVHDDLPCMDDDDLRRGRPTCHKVYGEAMAVLAGDALLNLAFETLSAAALDTAKGTRSIPGGVEGALTAMKEIADAAGHRGMIGGQAMDIAGEGLGMTNERLVEMHRRKTGALLRAPALAAARLSGAAPGVLDAVDRFASALGLAFQIKDDILDVTAEAGNLGKTPGKDAEAGKTTFVTAHGLPAATEMLAEESRRAVGALEELDSLGYDVEFLKDLVRYQLERGR